MAAVVRWVFEDYWRGVAQTTTFEPAGLTQTFTVPDTVTQVFIQARGGAGWGMPSLRRQTSGGFVSGWLQVNPGDILYVNVGGNGSPPSSNTGGAGGWNGGGNGGNCPTGTSPGVGGYGGGGASDIRYGDNSLGSRVAVAAGSGGTSGGGEAGYGAPGGAAGAVTGYTAANAPTQHNGGRGGTQTAGGGGGDPLTGPDATPGGQAGSAGVGGNGTNNLHTSLGSGSGGGGAGYYGGGGGGVSYSVATVGTAAQIAAYHNAQVAAHRVFGSGGGGGSNYIGGLDNTQPIVNQDGVVFTKLSTSPSPYISISYQQDSYTYTMEINPNDGGTPSIQKNIGMTQTVGPNRVNILQEGQSQAPIMDFSGVLLTQDQLEVLEQWFDRRVFIKVTDDLGREFYGVFSKFVPKRQRRASNFWYHTYDAELTLSAYKNASGSWVYGRVL